MIIDYRIERWKEVYPPNPAMLRLKMVNEGYSVVQWSDRPNSSYGSHCHPEDQSHWIMSGNLEIVLEFGGRHVLGPGDRDFMPANVYHTARVLGTEPVVYLVGVKQERASTTTSRSKKAEDVKSTRSGRPRKKRMTKAEKAAAEAAFDAMKKLFDNV